MIILKNFNGLFQNKLDLSAITFPDQIQVFEIDQQKNCQDVLFKYLQSLSSSKIQVKVCLDQKKFLGFSLDENGKLSVFQLDKKFIIRNSQLEPLRNDLCLKYTPQLELENEQMFFFEISPHHLIKFKIKNEKVSGVITRGYMFQKVQEFTDLKIHEIPRLFWPLKRAEQFFITRGSEKGLYNHISDLLRLRNTYDVFTDGTAVIFGGLSLQKHMVLRNSPYVANPQNTGEMNVVIVVNFDVTTKTSR